MITYSETNKKGSTLKTQNESYVFSSTLNGFLTDWIRYFEDQKKLEEKKFAGEDIGKDEQKKLDKTKKLLQRRKVDVLDKHIFRSMANLVVFFESLAQNQKLRELFEEDVKELLGFKGQDAKYEDNIITRLLKSILKWDSNTDPNNFRLELISSIQNVLFNKIIPLSLMDNKLGDSMTNGIVGPDVGRALLFARMFSSRYVYSLKTKDQAKEPNRPINF
jgi:hypothetical protein